MAIYSIFNILSKKKKKEEGFTTWWKADLIAIGESIFYPINLNK